MTRTLGCILAIFALTVTLFAAPVSAQTSRDFAGQSLLLAYQGRRYREDYVPRWLEGTFRGYDRKYEARITLTIDRDGSVSSQIRHSDGKRESQRGQYRNGKINIGGHPFWVNRTERGIELVQTDERNHRINFRGL